MHDRQSSTRRRSGHDIVDPFDPKYAHVPLDVPLSHVDDYVKRKNSRNDQDHLQSQIMFFKKEFGNLRCGKSRPKNNPFKMSSTRTTTTSSSTQTTTQNDDHKDDSEHDGDDTNQHDRNASLLNVEPMLHSDDFLMPSYESMYSFRGALVSFESRHEYHRWCRARDRRLNRRQWKHLRSHSDGDGDHEHNGSGEDQNHSADRNHSEDAISQKIESRNS